MISENLKKLIAKLPLPYKAVAIKICFVLQNFTYI